MQYLSIDYLIVYAFIAITLYIGLRSGRGVKDIRDYAIANKSFGTGALTLTLLATYIAGDSVIDDASIVYSSGIILMVALFAVSISFILVAIFIAPKAVQFDNCLTMGDLMKEFYGWHSGVIAGVLGLLNAVFFIGMGLHMQGIICESLLDIPANWGIILGGLLLAAYTAPGGIKSVVTTDVFQFIILAIFIPLIAYKALGKLGGIQELFQQVPANKLEIFNHKDFSLYLTFVLMWIIPAGMIDPAMIQRLLMAKTGNQIRNQYFIMAAVNPIFRFLIMLIGLSALVLYPNIESQQVVPHLIHNLLPIGIQGLAIAGLLAVNMSTTDSYLHAAGLTLVHDIIKPVYEQKNKSINEIKWSQYATILVSIAGIYIGLNTTDLLGLYLTSLELISPILMFPLFSAMMGLKADKQEFYVALGITIVAFGLAKLALPDMYSHFTVLISMAANGISFFGLHLIRNKGFVIVNRPTGEATIWQPRKKAFFNRLHTLLPTPKNIIAYSQVRVEQYGAPYILFGVFLLINYTIPYFIWTPTLPQYENFMLYLRIIGGVLCTLLIVREKWGPSLLPYMPTFWHFTVMYCLPFTSTIMLLLTGASIEWVVNIFGIIILLFVLLDWLTATIVGILGVSLGYAFYKLLIGSFAISLSFTDKYLMIYQSIFGILIGLLFARRRQLRYDRLATDNQILSAEEKEKGKAAVNIFREKIQLLKALKNANIEGLSTVVKEVKKLRKQLQTTATIETATIDEQLKKLETILIPMALGVTKIEHRAIDYLRLDIQPIAIEQLLEQLQSQLPKLNLQYIWKTKHQQIICDPVQLVKVIKNTILALPNGTEGQPVDYYLELQDTLLEYPLTTVEKGKTKQLPAVRFAIAQQIKHIPLVQPIYKPNMGASTLPSPASEKIYVIAEDQRIIKAHYGYTNIDINQTDYEYYLYVIPADVKEIRPSDMDDQVRELGEALQRANDQYPGAQEQEQAFLAALKEIPTINPENVQQALELIKLYHGSVYRRSGEPYYLHPLTAAQIAMEWDTDEARIIGALLHDTVEDTALQLEDVEMLFGPEATSIVDYVTHFESFPDSVYMGKLTDKENHEMLDRLIKNEPDKRALYIKIADRIHNMRTIEGHKTEDKKKSIAWETLFFFVPMALNLGLTKAAKELLERSVKVLNR